jgi:hypothetical protein
MDRLLVLCATMVFFCVSHADAQCLAYQQGTVGCPNYGAPAATAVPGPSMDGGVATVTTGQPAVTLFGGRVPPNGFIVRVFTTNGYPVPNGVYCFVNDNGPAGSGVGFYMPPDTANANNVSGAFESPHGYKPIGPVSIYCQTGAGSFPINVTARGW